MEQGFKVGVKQGSYVITPAGRVGRWAETRELPFEGTFAVVQSGGETFMVRAWTLRPAFPESVQSHSQIR